MRVAILTGAGDKAFCAGGDLKAMVADGMQVPPRDFFPLPYDSIERSKPTIAAVNGVAFAGGWMIAQACDLCVASTSANFEITEVKVGRSSPWAAPLIHMIPQRIMMEIILTGKPITAQRAYEIGLVNRIAEPEALMDTALALALEILDDAPLSVKAGRDTVMLATEMGRAAALHAERAASQYTYMSDDAQEGTRAFAESAVRNGRGADHDRRPADATRDRRYRTGRMNGSSRKLPPPIDAARQLPRICGLQRRGKEGVGDVLKTDGP